MLEKVKVTIGQVCLKKEDFIPESRLRIKNPIKHYESIEKVLQVARKSGAHFVLLPEFCVPRKYLPNLEQWAGKLGAIIIGGMEYGPGWCDDNDKNYPLINQAFVIIPKNLLRPDNYSFRYRKEATIVKITKLSLAPEEKKIILKNNYKYREGNGIYIFQSEILGEFAVLICFDFMNLPVQVLLQSSIQTLFIVAFNKDVSAFKALAETDIRLLLCNVVICNTGRYGGSLAYAPYRKPYERLVYQVEGNNVESAVTIELPLSPLRQIQRTPESALFDEEQRFFRKPPYYGQMAIKTRE
ncbi:hypothetical protein [Desulfofundulus australicus]|nr:hypothetical protein [Desulfofundulus australicus]